MERRDEIKEYLEQGSAILGFKIAVEARDNIINYFEMLLNKNESMNLISSKQNLKSMVEIHLLDSLTPLLLLLPALSQDMRCLDIGSGGGLPAIPLSLAYPHWRYDLAESTTKKAVFLDSVINTLSLSRLKIRNEYLESSKNKENIYYNLISARAVSELKKLLPIVGTRLEHEGLFLAFKGPQAQDELAVSIKELKKWKMELSDSLEIELPFSKAVRNLLLFKKR